LSADGVLYIGSDDNFLYALQTDSPGLAQTSWPKFRGDLQNTGWVGGAGQGQVSLNIYPTASWGLSPNGF